MGAEHCGQGVLPGVQSNSPVLWYKRNQNYVTSRQVYTSRRGVFITRKKSHRNSSQSFRKSGLLFNFFHCSKEARRQKANSESSSSEQVPRQETFQDGDTKNDNQCSKKRRLGGNPRSKRRIPSCSHSPQFQEVSEIQTSRGSLSIQSPPIRFGSGATGIYKNPSTDSGRGQVEGSICLPIFRRLAREGLDQNGGQLYGQIYHSITPGQRLDYKLGEITSESMSGYRIHRGQVPNRSKSGFSPSIKSAPHFDHYRSGKVSTAGYGKTVSEASGNPGGHNRSSKICQVISEASPALHVNVLEAKLQESRANDTSQSDVTRTSGMVGKSKKSVAWGPVTRIPGPDNSDIRCQPDRLGSSSGRFKCPGEMDSSSDIMAHKHARIGGSVQSLQTFPEFSQGQISDSEMRQCHYGDLHQSARGDKVSEPVYVDLEVSPVGPGSGCISESRSYPGQKELSSRQVESSVCESNRMGSEQSSSQANICPSGDPSNRPLCISGESAAACLLQQIRGQSGLQYRRLEYELGQYLGLCIPSNINYTPSVEEGERSQVQSDNDSSLLAKEILVCGSSGSGDRVPCQTSRCPRPAPAGGAVASGSSQSKFSGVEAERQRLRQEGFSEEVIHTLQSAIRPSTASQYGRKWAVFSSWCASRQVDPYKASIAQVLGFLQSLLNKGSQSLSGYRAAIGRYHEGINGLPISRHPRLTSFIAGAFKKNPPCRVLLPAWDLNVVLSVLQKPPFEPMASASIKACTLKTVFLVAITSARRCGEIQALGRKEGFLRTEAAGIRLRTVPSFLPKAATPQFLGQDVFVPSFCSRNKLLCPKRAVQYYLKATSDSGAETLFVAYGGKIKLQSVSKRTISGWIVSMIKWAYNKEGLGLPSVKAHSTRAMSTSWALYNKSSMDQVLKAADWRSTRTFAKHYGLDLWSKADGVFGKKVLKTASKSK